MTVSINRWVAGGNAGVRDESVASLVTKVMVNNDTIFTIVNGPIMIIELLSICRSANDITASTLQYGSNPTSSTATTISGATTTLASVGIGTTIQLMPTALSTAPAINLPAAGGVALGQNVANRIIVHSGTIKLVIGVGSTTGTWEHIMRYAPLKPGVFVY